ncbi:RodZ family helix-turn-helix domain-containing protein, partial [Acidocella sp.]|uniref:helix-turn-helix domain-containing protein n=1 Tax=Acidocella sp. TaxID=50710 RepID=UPI002624B37D
MPDDSSGIELMDDSANTAIIRAGAGLREVRERLGWKLPDVAAALRIKLEYLTAIEAGDLSPLPGQAYRMGFIRSYARLLGLDPEEILSRFRDAGALNDGTEIPMTYLAPVPDRAVPRGALVLIGLVLLLGIYGVWYSHSASRDHLAQSVPAVSAELTPLAPQVTTPVTAAATPPAPPPAAGQATTQPPAAPPVPPGAAVPAALDVATLPTPPGTKPATPPASQPAPAPPA